MVVVFIGGFLDGYSHYVRSFQEAYQQKYPEIKTFYFEWDEKKKIQACLERFEEEATVIGHSYGATTAISLLQEYEIDLLITVDPVSRFSTHKRPKVKHWININAKPSHYNISDVIAWIGGKWGESPKEEVDEYYEVVTNHQRFDVMLENINIT
jgi:pimeloyl-ACP methyl ester carboxylesterase